MPQRRSSTGPSPVASPSPARLSPDRPPPARLVVQVRPGRPTEGLIRLGALAVPCRLGRTGITRFKREGDGATPVAAMRVLAVLYRADRIARPATRLPVSALRRDDGWCDAPGDGRYNRPVRLPFAPSHEALWRDDSVYDVVVVLDWNVTRRSQMRGSAIFFHLTRPDPAPTAGCVAVTLPAMRRLLARLRPGAVLAVRG
ncbi:L,D-transpeptidase family protein [Prosthecomicrobium hirschii]|uniref:L,D-transpeptidase family protein n=1 Tax=Prosthecodimorpha hirschii TaxID=665126 RepID=UPI0026BE261A